MQVTSHWLHRSYGAIYESRILSLWIKEFFPEWGGSAQWMHFYQPFLIHWQTPKHKNCFCSLSTLTMTDIFFFIFSGKSFVRIFLVKTCVLVFCTVKWKIFFSHNIFEVIPSWVYCVSSNSSLNWAEGKAADLSLMCTSPAIQKLLSNETGQAPVEVPAAPGSYPSHAKVVSGCGPP